MTRNKEVRQTSMSPGILQEGMYSEPYRVFLPYIILTKTLKHERCEFYFYCELNKPCVRGNLTMVFPL